MGKSRLVSEFVSQAMQSHDVRLVEGRCLSYAQEVSLWLLADLLRSVFSISDADRST